MAMRDRCSRESEKPSFSSILLEEIYRSMDEGSERRSGDFKFYRETTAMERGRRMGELCEDMMEKEDTRRLRRASLIQTWMEKQISEKVINQGRQHLKDSDHDLDRDGLLFSSALISSDSSFDGFSSPGTESIRRPNSIKSSCLAPTRLKPPIRSGPSRSEKLDKKQRASSNKHIEFHMFEGFRFDRDSDENRHYDETIVKSKSRALKIDGHFKKVKDPISPGGRVANFLNSLFTTRMAKKTKNASRSNMSRAYSSASFSPSSPTKRPLSAREGLHSAGDKRTVRFYPVSVIVDEDCTPRGQKRLYEENEPSLMAATVQRYGSEVAREIERDLDFHKYDNGEEEDEEGAESCCSSDLFELDHSVMMELPVYETTRFDTNHVMGEGL